MKKAQKLLIGLLTVILSAAIFLACGDKDNSIDDNGEYITITIGSGGVETSQSYIGGVLDELNSSGELHVKFAVDTGYGRWLEEIGSLIPDASSQYIALYTTDYDLNHVDPLTTKELEGKTYYYTLKGIDELPAIDGATYLFLLETF